jgi:hypothetical protein
MAGTVKIVAGEEWRGVPLTAGEGGDSAALRIVSTPTTTAGRAACLHRSALLKDLPLLVVGPPSKV